MGSFLNYLGNGKSSLREYCYGEGRITASASVVGLSMGHRLIQDPMRTSQGLPSLTAQRGTIHPQYKVSGGPHRCGLNRNDTG